MTFFNVKIIFTDGLEETYENCVVILDTNELRLDVTEYNDATFGVEHCYELEEVKSFELHSIES